MGHHTATVAINLSDAERARESARTVRPYMYGRTTWESEMVTLAVKRWSDEEADRYSDPRNGDGVIAPITAKGQVDTLIDVRHDTVVKDSLVIPVAAPADVLEVTRKVVVEVTAEQMRTVRQEASARDGKLNLYGELFDLIVPKNTSTVSEIRLVSLPKPRKATATPTPGSMATEYQVVGSRYGTRHVYDRADTFAEAKQKATALLDEYPTMSELRIEAVQVRLTDDGLRSTALATIERPEKAQKLTFEVVSQEVRAGAKPDHYVVAFDYHS